MENAWELAMQSLIRAAANYNKPIEGDYKKDGLLHCHICNTPKECVISLKSGELTVPCMCECKKAQAKAEEENANERARQIRIEDNRRACFALPQWEKATFAKDDNSTKLSAVARNYVGNFDKMNGKGLLLFGGIGSGKTFISACIANALLDKGYRVRMINFAIISNELQQTFDKADYYDELLDCDLLILDDLAAERKTDYMNEIVYQIINSRYSDGRPMIVTTNLTASQIKHPTDISMERVTSRLMEACIPFEVQGSDRRKETLKSEYADYSKLLGVDT